jgi:hypothetical protein
MFNAMVGSGLGEEDSIAVLKLLESCRGRHEGRLHRPGRHGASDGPAFAARRARPGRLGTPPASVAICRRRSARRRPNWGGCEVVFTVITPSADVEAVALGADGLIEGMAPGSVLVDCSTIAPDVARHIAARLGKRHPMLDAPVSGGAQGPSMPRWRSWPAARPVLERAAAARVPGQARRAYRPEWRRAGGQGL